MQLSHSKDVLKFFVFLRNRVKFNIYVKTNIALINLKRKKKREWLKSIARQL